MLWYDRCVYIPLQQLRMLLLGWIPFSIGDIAYIVAGGWLLVTVIRWVVYLVKRGACLPLLYASLLNCLNTILLGYLSFLVAWGIHYDKISLREHWQLTDNGYTEASRNERRVMDSTAMVSYETLLVDSLNAYAPRYATLSFEETERRALKYYNQYTDCPMKRFGLSIKPTLFGMFLERMAVEGYYNPFSGEGQVNTGLSQFMLPFVVCHEMAHQAGIAAEDDANLMAYALGTSVDDPSFRYSAYLNIWFYTHGRVRRRDSVMAKRFYAQLNNLTKAHIDTLEKISEQYHHEVAEYSSELYDSYLRLQNQKDGIRSYSNVARSAWLLEEQRRSTGHRIISMP